MLICSRLNFFFVATVKTCSQLCHCCVLTDNDSDRDESADESESESETERGKNKKDVSSAAVNACKLCLLSFVTHYRCPAELLAFDKTAASTCVLDVGLLERNRHA